MEFVGLARIGPFMCAGRTARQVGVTERGEKSVLTNLREAIARMVEVQARLEVHCKKQSQLSFTAPGWRGAVRGGNIRSEI